MNATAEQELLHRAQTADAANAIAKASRSPGAPQLAHDSSLITLCRWLQWCDPNGCHLPELAEVEDFAPYTLEEAWDEVRAMCEDA